MMFILGIITGLTLCIFITIIYTRFDTMIERTVRQTASRLQTKGEILEPEDQSLTQWLETLEKSS